jgi:hypothetical protein
LPVLVVAEPAASPGLQPELSLSSAAVESVLLWPGLKLERFHPVAALFQVLSRALPVLVAQGV